jgi:glycine hydroxymethyltransferase
VEKILDLSHITLNKNSVPGDTSALIPGGIRIGSPAMTTRGMTEADFVRVADLIDQGVQIAIDIKKKTEGGKLKDFKAYLDENDVPAIAALRAEVEAFADEFHMPGGPVI